MSARVRSPGLLALSVALMASSGALAYVLQHDAVGETSVLELAKPGDDVTVKGTLRPFVVVASSAQEATAWAAVKSHLDNFTYELETGSVDEMVLVTSPQRGPAPGSEVVTDGPVVLRIAHPDGSGRALVVVHARALESPILFR